MHAELKLAAQDLIVERVVDTANRTAGIVRAGNAAYARRVRIRSKQCRHRQRRPGAGARQRDTNRAEQIAELHAKRFTCDFGEQPRRHIGLRSEEHTSELQSLMRISYAVLCLKKKQ